MIIKRPGGRHLKFRLLENIGGRYVTKSAPELDGINTSYLSGRMTLEQAHHRLKELVLAWEAPRKGQAKLTRNEAFVLEFWDKSPKGACKPRKNPHSQATSKAGYLEAARLLHKLDIETASVSQVLRILGSLDKTKQRKLASRLNTLWAWANRPATQRIPLPRLSQRDSKNIIALPLDEIVELSKKLPGPLNLYCLAAFGCGARPGEMFALTPDDLRAEGTHLWIDKTLDQKFQAQDTKNNKVGTAYVIKECRKALGEWLHINFEDKCRWWRKSKHAGPFKQVFGHDPYVLRHSYARHMLGKGATLVHLRMWMRDDMKTIERYYLKWEITSAEIASNLVSFD
jgi:integrase